MCYDSNEVNVSLSLFSADSYDKMRKLTDNPKDLMVIEELERLAMDEKFIYLYDAEQERKMTENSIRSESYEKGLEVGIEQGKLEIASNLLKTNLSVEDISKITGLTVEEIENLK